jgi:GntR family transcriptional regulator/MocR family aminotransferase
VVGGFCELLTPALKLGYAVVPTHLADVIGRRVGDRAEQPPYVTQLAVAKLLGDGTVVRLMHRLGRLYAGNRRLLRPLLHRLRLATAYGVNTAVVSLPAGLGAATIAGHLRTRGVRVETLAPYHFSGRPAPDALVIGYGHQPDATLRHAMSILAEVLAGHGWRSGLR